MNIDEKAEVYARIDALIGSYDDLNIRIELYSLSDRISAREQYRRQRERLMKIAEKGGIKALHLTVIDSGIDKHGITPSGKKFVWSGNNGMTERSRYCGTLILDGEMIFTSGTIAKAFEYILKN